MGCDISRFTSNGEKDVFQFCSSSSPSLCSCGIICKSPPSDSGQVHENRGERGGEVQLRRSGSHLL